MKKRDKKALNLKIKKAFIIAFCIVIAVVLFLESGMIYIHKKGAWKPNYDMIDISEIILKENISAEEYNIISDQSGLSEKAVKEILAARDYDRILAIQKAYFITYKVQHEIFAPFTCSDRLDTNIPLAPLEEGDIIISPSSHISYLTSGHAAIVVNAKEGRILNATGYGYVSALEDITELSCRPGFAILRLKADKEKRAEIAKYALENLYNINYSLVAGIFRGNDEKIKSTHCSHLVWYAFKRFGYDIDSNKGPAVWPRDIANSNLLEVVQIYGVNPKNFWK